MLTFLYWSIDLTKDKEIIGENIKITENHYFHIFILLSY